MEHTLLSQFGQATGVTLVGLGSPKGHGPAACRVHHVDWVAAADRKDSEPKAKGGNFEHFIFSRAQYVVCEVSPNRVPS